jgi:hypothetical protein
LTPRHPAARPVLAAALLAPLVATAGVAVFAGAPRSPVAYCRTADLFFTNLSDSGHVQRAAAESWGDERSLRVEGPQARAHTPAAYRADWDRIDAAAVRMEATGLAATQDQPQPLIDASLQRVYRDFRRRCAAIPFDKPATPLDTAGLVGQPPAVVYCQRALVLFADLVAHTGGTDQETRDGLVSEAERVVTMAPAPVAGDWAATLDTLRRLQRTGSAVDATHAQEAVDGALQRLDADYSDRCPTPIPSPSG